MSDQTSDDGRQLEELYEQCMKRPPAEREAFIRKNAAGNQGQINQLLGMVGLEMPTAAYLVAGQNGSFVSPGAVRSSEGHDVFEFEKDTVFGHCQIISGYGGGAMGDVYLAQDLENHRRNVALKVMKPRLLGKEDQQRFHNETFALSLLVHPNIARLYFWGVESWNGTDRPFLVMEFVDGHTLEKYLVENKLSQRQVLELLRKICLAVHHGHLKGVYHRDLKPSNILMTREGEPKIVDFGVSFTLSADSKKEKATTLNENVGTAPYMAPEVAGGLPYKLDPASDVYSLGIIAFEALVNRRPGVELDTGELELLEHPHSSHHIRGRIATCERERLRGAQRRFGRDLDAVIARSLRLNPGDRYSDAAEFAEDLRRVAHREPIRQWENSRIYQAVMFTRRNPLLVAAVALVFISILTAAVVFGVAVVRVDAARKIAIERGDKIQQQNAAAHVRAAELADQRGNWAVSAEEYHWAGLDGYPDRLKLAVGELRALDRSNHPTEATALIERIEKDSPDVARASQFQIADGFFNWGAKPVQSTAMIKAALQTGEPLAPADRAFAEALTTDDFRVAAARLRETVDSDPFNYDGLALLAVCDLALGDAHRCELDAEILRKMYPSVDTGAVLAAFGSAFEGRPQAAIASLESAATLSNSMRSSLIQTVELIDRYHSLDDIHLLSKLELVQEVMGVIPMITSLAERPGGGAIRVPVLFNRIAQSLGSGSAMFYFNPSKYRNIIAQLPNGDGELMAAQIALEEHRTADAKAHLAVATTAPALIDGRRHAACLLAGLHAAANRGQKDVDGAGIAEKDLGLVIALGGVRPDVFSLETYAVTAGVTFHLYPQVQTLALMWLEHAPKDPEAFYFLGVADFNLNQSRASLGFFQQAIGLGLQDETMKKDAMVKMDMLSHEPATQWSGEAK